MEVIRFNKVLLTDEMSDPVTANERFQWARRGDGPKAYKQLQREFIEDLNEIKRQSLHAKKLLKQKKHAKLLSIIDACRAHGGPLNASTVDALDNLSDEQVLQEVCFSRYFTLCGFHVFLKDKTSNCLKV